MQRSTMSVTGLLARFGRLSLAPSQQLGVRSLHSSGIIGKDATPQGFGEADRDASPLFQQVIKEATENLEQEARADGSGSTANLTAKEFCASTSNFKTSTRKLRFLANQIAGLDVQEAIRQMEFSAKKSSKKILGTLALARNNARLQKSMDPAKLYVARAWVGKGQYLKRIRYHGRGQFGTMHHPSAHLKFALRERGPAPLPSDRSQRRNIRGWHMTKKVWTALQDKPIYNPKPYYNW
ncbi:ribosomal protein L22/L17 [Syncephalis plumigaleata]|nr:ribosomal protein L22/L17 [Syncephalis plumigaleata]